MPKETTAAPVTPATPVAATKPFSITIIAPGAQAFEEASVLIRNGYVFNKDMLVQIMPNGQAIMHLVLGTPDEAAIARAKESVDLGLKQQEMAYQKDVREEAKRLVEMEKREQLEKQVADAVAASEKAIAKMRKDAQAELDKLSQ